MRIAITGSTGLIGNALFELLASQGHQPIRMVRRDPKPGADEIRWLPSKGEIDAPSLEGIDHVVHLAGASVGGGRWTAKYKDLILKSRTEGTKLLADTLSNLDKKPESFLSGSAIGFYGTRDDEELDEQSTTGDTFLADVCRQWEAATESATNAGIRTCHLRTGIVLSPTGGAHKKMLPLFKLFVGGKYGDGSQLMSWITLDDMVKAISHLMFNSTVSGPVNMTAPNPVTNAEFTNALGAELGRPTVFTVPKFGPSLVLGSELAQALLFDSQKVKPTVLLNDGFEFANPEVEAALAAVL